jgi:hypothetical protein
MNIRETTCENQRFLCLVFFSTIVVMTGVYAQKSEQVHRVMPDDDLQQVLDGTAPGKIIILAPGTYGGLITIKKGGDAGAPVIIRAEESGTVSLTNAMPPEFRLEFVKVKGDLYRAPVPWQVRWVMVEGHRNLMDYVTLTGLETFRAMGNDIRRMKDGPPEGFAWENGFLYVRLLGGKDPNHASVEIHRETSVFNEKTYTLWGGRSFKQGDGFILDVRAPHVSLEGLKFHLAPDIAVQVNADNVTIRDCYFDGCIRGIESLGSANLTVEYCEYSGYPTYQWVRWGQLNDIGGNMGLWNVIYASNLCNTFIHHYGPSVKVRHCLVYEAFDGMWPRNMGTLDPQKTSEYAYNLFMSAGDECIEFDTRTPINLRVHHNFIMDAMVPLALSPIQGGGLMIDHNIVYISPERGLIHCTLLKFDCPWRQSYDAPSRGITMVHNTFVNSHHTLSWTKHNFVDCIFENNVMMVNHSSPWEQQGYVPTKHNIYTGPNVDPKHMPPMLTGRHPGFRQQPDFIAEPLPVLPLQETGLAVPARTFDGPYVDFGLCPDSPAVDAGASGTEDEYHHVARGKASDLGAIELGEDWSFPQPGPRWAVGGKKPWRPELPPSLHPSWVGLDH